MNIYILLDGCLTHDHVSESGHIVYIEKAQSERGWGSMELGFRSRLSLIAHCSCFPQVVCRPLGSEVC